MNQPHIAPAGWPLADLALVGVSDETWHQRVDRRFQAIASERPVREEDRDWMMSDAQFYADKQMLNEIHLMLRVLCARMAAS